MSKAVEVCSCCIEHKCLQKIIFYICFKKISIVIVCDLLNLSKAGIRLFLCVSMFPFAFCVGVGVENTASENTCCILYKSAVFEIVTKYLHYPKCSRFCII